MMMKRLLMLTLVLCLVGGAALAELSAPEGTVYVEEGGMYLTATTEVLGGGELLFAGARAISQDGTDAGMIRQGVFFGVGTDGKELFQSSTEEAVDASTAILGRLADGTVVLRMTMFDENMERQVTYGTARLTGADNGLEGVPDVEFDLDVELPEGLRADDPSAVVTVGRLGYFNVISSMSQATPLHILYDESLEPVFTIELDEVAGIEPMDAAMTGDGVILAGMKRLEEGGVIPAAYKIGLDGSLKWLYVGEAERQGAFRDVLALEEGGAVLTTSAWDDLTIQGGLTCLDGEGKLAWESAYNEIDDAQGVAPIEGGYVTVAADSGVYARYTLLCASEDGELLGTCVIGDESDQAYLFVDIAYDSEGGAYAYGTYAPDFSDPSGLRVFFLELTPALFEVAA